MRGDVRGVGASRMRTPQSMRRMVVAGSAPRSGVGDARLLEVEDVEEGVAEDLAHHLHRRHRRTRQERHAHAAHPGDPVGVQQRHLPDDHRPPVVADEDGPLRTEVVEQAEEVVGQVDDVVVVDRVGPVERP